MEQIIFSDEVVTSAAQLNCGAELALVGGFAGGKLSQRMGRGP